MWRASVLVFALLGVASGADASLWGWIKGYDGKQLQREAPEVRPAAAERRLIARLLRAVPPETCAVVDPKQEWLKNLRYRLAPVRKGERVILVEAGEGCARGGQGSNGSMWLVRTGQGVPAILAGERQGFSGFLYSLRSSPSMGYRDVVLGWHYSAGEFSLAYFRFRGTRYRMLRTAIATQDANGGIRIRPN